MKREWEHPNLRGAYKPVPEAFRQAVLRTVRSVGTDGPVSAAPARSRHTWGIFSKRTVLALIGLLLLGMAAACAVARPALLTWLLGYDGAANSPYPAGAALAATVQEIRGENAADHITVRMNSLVYDGERFSFSYEVENDAPAEPALVAMEPCFRVDGAPVRLEEFLANDAAPRLVPSPHLDTLPARRNPIVCGGWSQVLSKELNGETACEMTFIVYRPQKAFAIVPDPEDPIFHPEDCAPQQQAEIRDVIDTCRGFRNAVLADRDAADPEAWFRAGYSVVGGFIEPADWVDPNEDGFDHLIETARINVAFSFDAGIRQAFDFSGMEEIALEDCAVRVSRLRLSPLSTDADILLIPRENTEEAARALARKYGPLTLTDERGNPVEYAQMEFLCDPAPWVSCRDGQWRCRYLIQMPGLQTWPQSVGLTVNTGELLRVELSALSK